MHFFDESYSSDGEKCTCCYVCISNHSEEGCYDCSAFLKTFFPSCPRLKLKKSVASEVRDALSLYFSTLRVESLLVEDELIIPVEGFIKDFLKMCDEVTTENDIEDLWKIDSQIAYEVFQLFREVVDGNIEDYQAFQGTDARNVENKASEGNESESDRETESETDSSSEIDSETDRERDNSTSDSE